MSDAERIAARLSPAQRRIMMARQKNTNCLSIARLPTADALYGIGVIVYPSYYARLTTLGHEVRAVLAREARDE